MTTKTVTSKQMIDRIVRATQRNDRAKNDGNDYEQYYALGYRMALVEFAGWLFGAQAAGLMTAGANAIAESAAGGYKEQFTDTLGRHVDPALIADAVKSK